MAWETLSFSRTLLHGVIKWVYMCHIPHYIFQRFGCWQCNNIILTDVIVNLSHIFSYGSDFSEESGHNLCKNVVIEKSGLFRAMSRQALRPVHILQQAQIRNNPNVILQSCGNGDKPYQSEGWKSKHQQELFWTIGVTGSMFILTIVKKM